MDMFYKNITLRYKRHYRPKIMSDYVLLKTGFRGQQFNSHRICVSILGGACVAAPRPPRWGARGWCRVLAFQTCFELYIPDYLKGDEETEGRRAI